MSPVASNGRNKARRLYPELGFCEAGCGRPARDRHHRDGDTENNRAENVVRLCRRCHMEVDGRLAEFLRYAHAPKWKPPRACRTCGKPARPLRRGECNACYLRGWRARRVWNGERYV